MNESPIHTTKTYEAIIQRLLEAIQSEKFPPGSKLPSVRQLSTDWQVGQAAVREALSALKAMNLITSRQGEGTFVNSFTPNQIAKSLKFGKVMESAEIQSLLELRLILESGAARLAAQRYTSSDLEDLQEILLQMEDDLTIADLGEQSDWRFHYSLTKASKNPFLITLMESVQEKVQSSQLSSRLAFYRIEGEPKRLLDQHQAILEAVAQGNAEAAEKAMVRHLQHVESKLNELDGEGDNVTS